jgi:small conductance mechanosensitive channel
VIFVDRLAQYLNIEEIATMAVAFMPRLIAAVLVLVAFLIVFRLTRRPLEGLLGRAGLHRALVNLLVGNIYRLTLLCIGLIMAAGQVGINVGAALAGIGVIGIAVGFAAQDSLSNTIAGFLIFIDKPFLVGDFVTVSGQYGRVTHITMRSTRIRTPQNTYVVIPNKNIIDEVLANHSKHGETRVDVPVGIAYKEYIPEARRVILEALQSVEGVEDTPPPDVVVTELGGSSVNMDVRVWIGDAAEERAVYAGVIEASKLALDAAGIQIPYPHLQLFIDDVEDRVWERLEGLPRAGNDS